MSGDRGELVSLEDAHAHTYLSDAFDWVRDLAAKGARSAADTVDDWTIELDKLNFNGSDALKSYLREQGNWVSDLFAEILSLVELINPLTIGKQIAIWILEDFRDVLRALALLVDSKDDTAEETKGALVELGMAAAALCIPYVGRAGKVIYRMLPKFANMRFAVAALETGEGAAMLRFLGTGDTLGYLKGLNFPSYAGKINSLLRQIFDKIGAAVGRYLPKMSKVISEWYAKISGWVTGALKQVQTWVAAAVAKLQHVVYNAATNITNPKVLDKIPDKLLDWMYAQINGNLCESCVDNYFINFMGYSRLFPAPNTSKRDTSAFFGSDQGIDGLFEKEPSVVTGGTLLPPHYNGIPNSLGWILDELDVEIPGEQIAKAAISRSIKPFGDIDSDFNPVTGKPATFPRFVVMEAKFGYHVKSGNKLQDIEWKNKLGTTTTGVKQMSRTWIDQRLRTTVFPPDPTTGRVPQKLSDIQKIGYLRWLYGCQPANAKNSKKARARGGRRMQGLAFFPPYALRGYDIDKMKWNV
ncbi:hypothetical protein GmRootV118_63910 [Variovorax sp. V118]|uniref:hypothetical protein n=1 Tax=Variovorax sp. V118 TaxID=3065954 RepID=UPI0034E8EDEF